MMKLLHIPQKINIEDYVVEDKVMKGVRQTVDLTKNGIGNHIIEALNVNPHHVVQIEAQTGKQTTCAEMKEFSIRCGIWLKKQGIRSNDIVVVCSKNNLDIYAPILGTFYIGGTFAGWNPFSTNLKTAQHLMNLLKPKVIFAGVEIIDTLEEAAKLENIDTKFVVFGKHANFKSLDDVTKSATVEEVHSFQPRTVNVNDTAAIFLTSGSTGITKGVAHTYKNVLKMSGTFLPYRFDGVVMWYSTCDWITGLFLTIVSILLQGTRILHDKFEVEETCRIIEKYKVNRMLLTNLAIIRILKTNAVERYDFQSLKFVISCGCTLNPQSLKDFREGLPNVLTVTLYGMSETGCITSQTENSKSLSSVGFVTSNINVKIIDRNTGETLGVNEPGEICVQSEVMMSGYYNNPKSTQEVFDGEGWLHTGDIGFYDENGEVVIVDRIKNLIKYQLHQISPIEIENVLLSHPCVMEVAVVPLPHIEDSERPMAFVKKIPGSQVTEEELVELSASVLGELKMLHGGVKFLDDLPKTSNGKINRPVLKANAKVIADGCSNSL